MKRKTSPQNAFFYLRVAMSLFMGLTALLLALTGLGVFSAQAEPKPNITTLSTNDPLVPALFDCSRIKELGIDVQENLRAGAIMIACGEAAGGEPSPVSAFTPNLQKLLGPLAFGTTDANLITGTETSPNVTQSETFAAANPDNPLQIVVAYNDSRGRAQSPVNISGASASTDGGNTFTRITTAGGQSPFASTLGDPVVLYNRITSTWFTVWLDTGCGSQGLGGYKTTTPLNAASWTHYCVHSGSSDDRESGWIDNNPASPFYGRMYISWNDFARSSAIYVRYSTDNGLTWTNERQITTTFFRNVQITGDSGSSGAVYIAAMNENGGGLTTRSNRFYRSTDGGNTWTNTYIGPSFSAPGRTASGSFATMYSSPAYWRHQGWGQPAALNGIVHYVYGARNTVTGDPGDVFYIRSTDNGVTFGAPFQLNTNTDPTRAQWQASLSVTADGNLLATWYDERDRVAASCQPSNPATPCYRIWARKSTDNGVTWLADDSFSDVVSPLPLQPDPGIVSIYVGDYDYASSVLNQNIRSWADGRVSINGASQQNAFVDRDPMSASSPTPTAPPTISISGNVSYCVGSPQAVLNVLLSLTGGTMTSTMTNGSGAYLFSSLPSGGNYTVTPTKANLPPGLGTSGIDVSDALAIQKHLISSPPLTGCALSAADVDGSGDVTIADALAIQQFRNFSPNPLPAANICGQWRFSPANRAYMVVGSDQTSQNYDAYALGDVTGDLVIPARPVSPEPVPAAPARPQRGSAPVTLETAVALPNVPASLGDFVAPVTVSKIAAGDRLMAFQGDIAFDSEAITFQSAPVGRTGLTANGNWALAGKVIGEGRIKTLRVSCFALDPGSVLAGEGPLFELRMTMIGNGRGANTELVWSPEPNGFIFIDENLTTRSPGRTLPGKIGAMKDRR